MLGRNAYLRVEIPVKSYVRTSCGCPLDVILVRSEANGLLLLLAQGGEAFSWNIPAATRDGGGGIGRAEASVLGTRGWLIVSLERRSGMGYSRTLFDMRVHDRVIFRHAVGGGWPARLAWHYTRL